MRFKLSKASDSYDEPYLEIKINSLDDLKELSEHYQKNYKGNNAENWMKNCALIIDFVAMEITIYDSWME